MDFKRFAIYYTAEGDLARRGAAWLGWDVAAGRSVLLDAPPAEGLDLPALTEAPRRYGFHATLKPPFRLAEGETSDHLSETVSDLAAKTPSAIADGLEVAWLGSFLALRPVGDATEINTLAATMVRDLDRFRAPSSQADLERRRAAKLSSEEDANLVRWGYPYVMDAFRFHMTLTGRLPKEVRQPVEAAARTHFEPVLPAPFTIGSVTLVGEDYMGRFHEVHRFALSG